MKMLALVLAIAFVLLAIIYWVGAFGVGHHVKHTILFIVLAVLSLIWMRFANTAEPARH